MKKTLFVLTLVCAACFYLQGQAKTSGLSDNGSVFPSNYFNLQRNTPGFSLLADNSIQEKAEERKWMAFALNALIGPGIGSLPRVILRAA